MIVVTGAPCSGKPTYIREHAQPGDIIIDLDRIALALTTDGTPHHQYGPHVRHTARAARTAAINAALHAHHATGCRVWVIDTWPKLNAWRKVGAEVIVIDPGYGVCMARAVAERPGYVQQIIHDWYSKRQAAADS